MQPKNWAKLVICGCQEQGHSYVALVFPSFWPASELQWFEGRGKK